MDVAQIITALAVAIPAIVAAYIQLRKFRNENNAANKQMLAEQKSQTAAVKEIATSQAAVIEATNGNYNKMVEQNKEKDRQITRLVEEAAKLKAETDAANLRTQQVLTHRIREATKEVAKEAAVEAVKEVTAKKNEK